jgi:hypothetical protein
MLIFVPYPLNLGVSKALRWAVEMTDLQWNLGWTLATLGVCWLALSCVVALALGQIIRRSKTSAEPEQSSTRVEPSIQVARISQELAESRAQSQEQPSHDYGSRAASGTRLKPVRLDQEQGERTRKVS